MNEINENTVLNWGLIMVNDRINGLENDILSAKRGLKRAKRSNAILSFGLVLGYFLVTKELNFLNDEIKSLKNELEEAKK